MVSPASLADALVADSYMDLLALRVLQAGGTPVGLAARSDLAFLLVCAAGYSRADRLRGHSL